MKGKTSQKERILLFFKENNNKFTLGQAAQHSFFYELRARISELRHQGYSITCIKGLTPSENVYVLEEPLKFDSTGQAVFA